MANGIAGITQTGLGPIVMPGIQSTAGQQALAGLNRGFQLGMQMDEARARQQAQQQQARLAGLQIQQAENQLQAQTEAQERQILQSIATGAEQALKLSGPEREAFLVNRAQQLRAQGRDSSDTVEALEVMDRFGADSPEANAFLTRGIQLANSFGEFTPTQIAQQQAMAKGQEATAKERAGFKKEVRKEFLSTAGKQLLEGREQITKIRQAETTGIGDVALMKTINKMIDSGIVTDSDFDQVAQSSGIADSFQGMVNKILGGGSLNENTRQQIRNQAEKLWSAKVQSAESVAEGLRQDASEIGIQEDVIPSAFRNLFEKERGQTGQAPQQQAGQFTTASGISFTVE